MPILSSYGCRVLQARALLVLALLLMGLATDVGWAATSGFGPAFNQAVSAYNAGQLDEADRHLRVALRQLTGVPLPYKAAARLMFGRVKNHQQLPELAEEYCSAALADYKTLHGNTPHMDLAGAYLCLAEAAALQQAWPAAVKQNESALRLYQQLDPTNAAIEGIAHNSEVFRQRAADPADAQMPVAPETPLSEPADALP